jgi:dihydrodipicolinate synthase/N-acetylneuraminate lyase
MDRNTVSWQGPMPAIVTPFDDQGRIEPALFRRNIELLIDRGATGVVVGGCTGEFWALDMNERRQLFELGVAAAPSLQEPVPFDERMRSR